MEELSHITKIMEVGNMGIRAFYALSEEGDVYAWGSNRSCLVDSSQGGVEQYEKPIRFGGLANIVEMDAKDDHGFAVDNGGQSGKRSVLSGYDSSRKQGISEGRLASYIATETALE